MKKRWIKRTCSAVCALLALAIAGLPTKAEAQEEYITIAVEAADENGPVTYALDTDDPAAFDSVNEFTVPAGTKHTIYVRDGAGNITSQVFEAEAEPAEATVQAPTDLRAGETAETDIPIKTEEILLSEGDGEVYIDLELDTGEVTTSSPGTASYEYLTDTPAEAGEGTVYSRVDTVPGNDASRIFYTITTKEGEVFYMVVDSTQSADNVYLLDQVKLSDLEALAEDGGEKKEEEKPLVASLQEENTQEEAVPPKKGGIPAGNLLLLLAFAAAGGFFYYKKVYQNKKEEVMDLMDARDLEDFAPEEEEEEEAYFDTEEEEQEQILRELMGEGMEDPLLNADPEEYADGLMDKQEETDQLELDDEEEGEEY